MTVFNRTLVTEDHVAVIRSEPLGDNTRQYSTDDVGALVKLSGGAYILCADGDDIEGQVMFVAPHTVNDGFSFGTVKMSHRIEVLKGNLAVGNFAVAGVQVLGAASISTAKQGAGVNYKWRCIEVGATHAILERV